MRTNALSVLVRLGLLAVTMLLMVIIRVRLMSVLAAENLLGIVGLSNLCIEKEQFIINCRCIFVCKLRCTPVATICIYESSCWLLCNLFYRSTYLSTEKERGDYQ